ncbi:RNF121 protein [Thecamonas trahens ATCC 50062]|uniref:RNF121 protein n=1 Tax=Thecamonas trahens ATCC 50062 TaxID=461836 RepID=A0A0L0DV18_THETB|nr:RNF121 protein [Thecamonas trahens ATCC 50062]KNC55373.1 RNF121 protein [Thecamonas trahens ATCC 50062]|eukprot:XP_013753007.1 RNF121 protein [Thecamonas trahens ATCC 50062]
MATPPPPGTNMTAAIAAAVAQGMSEEEAREAVTHAGHESMHSAMFFILVAAMIGAQIGLHLWKSRHARSYHMVSLLGLWLFPAILSLYHGYGRMLVVWITFTVVTAWLGFKASRKPLHQRTPRLVYTWFSAFYRLFYAIGVIGYILVMAEFFGVTHLLSDSHSLAYYGSLMLFYGLYYGVLSRDAAELATSSMAVSMGIKTGKDDGLASRRFNPDVCAICGDGLDRFDETEKVCELDCKHAFHEFCIRGWTIIGKKDTCPFCTEKVNLKAMFRNPWESQSIFWGNLLSAIRALVVWNPLIVLTVQPMSESEIESDGPVRDHDTAIGWMNESDGMSSGDVDRDRSMCGGGDAADDVWLSESESDDDADDSSDRIDAAVRSAGTPI